MSDSLNERAARQLAEEKEFAPEQIRYCAECGRTVVFSKNPFNDDDRQGSVYCTCDPKGPPMVRLEAGDE